MVFSEMAYRFNELIILKIKKFSAFDLADRALVPQ